MDPTPPRLPRALLERLLPGDARSEALLGDLHEEYVRRAATRPWRARLDYWSDAVGVGVRTLVDRRRRARRAPGDPWMDTLLRNLTYAFRRLLRSPFFTAVAMVSLALGIGANTAMFSVVNALVLRPVPLDRPEELVDVYWSAEGFTHGVLSIPDYRDLREASRDVFADVGGSQLTIAQSDTDGGVEMLTAEAVTGSYFGMLGVEAAAGRLFTADDDVAIGAHPVTVLGHALWERRFGADPAVVGRELRLGGRAFTVVGVMEPGFAGSIRGLSPDIYVPLSMYEVLQPGANVFEGRGNHSFFAKARLLPGVGLEQARAVLDRLAADMRRAHPDEWTAENDFVLVPTTDVIMNPMIDRVLVPALGVIMAVVGLVLLIACANLASFLLTRAADRRKEIAVRLAMGARRSSLVGQLMTETMVLAVAGGAAGVLLARWALRLLTTADLPLPLPITLDLSLDGRVLLFSLAVTAAAGVLFGLAPALQGTRADLAGTLRDEAGSGGRGRGARMRDALVMVQVAVSVVLLVGSGLFLRSLDASRRIDPGFGAEPAAVVDLLLPTERAEGDARLAALDELEARVGGLPGVTAVGLTSNLHLTPTNTSSASVIVDGVAPPAGQDFHRVDAAAVSGAFFEAVDLALLEGRVFDGSDAPDGDLVVMVNEAFARRFFDGAALGRTLRVGDREARVVGVVATARIRQLGEEPRPFLYRNVRQTGSTYLTVVARVGPGTDAGATALEALRAFRAWDPSVVVYETRTMARHLAVMLLPRELGAWVVSGFAALALLLASIGLYGVVSYAVARRAREVGIRLSLGAEAGEVVWMLTRGGMRLVLVGGVVGLVVAALVGQLLARLLYGIAALDPVTFLAVPAALGLVALAASWIPARRASRVDPVSALRSE